MFRELTANEVRDVYTRHMKLDFPPEELKPLERIEQMRKTGEYRCFGMFQDGSLKAYAMMAEPESARVVLLDYLAAVRTERSSGHGSQMLKAVGDAYAQSRGILIEAEDPAFAADQADREIRERRIRFYLRNEARETGVYARVFGADYRILFLGKARAEDGEILEEYQRIYRRMLSPAAYEKNVKMAVKSV